MMGRVGLTTATTRSKGNHSSRWTYNNGASSRASCAELSVANKAPGTGVGRGGMCACGPQAAVHEKTSPAAVLPARDKLVPWLVLEI
jgi:hypothetical protein